MIRLVFHLVTTAYWWLHAHAPTNRLVQRVRSAPRLGWTPICLLIALACLTTAAGLGAAIQHGAPGWLNLAVLAALWDGVKIGCLAPANVAWTIRARLACRRYNQQTDAAMREAASMADGTVPARTWGSFAAYRRSLGV
ncbi:MAG: hypothetical protein FWF36_00255 [Propionibacteriaceae bacterium]|nr:hypothetical protein [Propionibacteriaceae bacterium]